jgi:hypothetical protein
MRWFEKPPRLLLGLALLWVVAFIVTFSDAGVPFPTWLALAGGFLAIAVVWAIRLVIAFSNRKVLRAQWRYWISIPSILIVAFALGGSPALLIARVYLSSDALVKNAGSFEEADARWIGLFHVRQAVRFDNESRFLTNECGLLDTCGIAFSPNGEPKHRGEDSFIHLYGPWWHWYQSW